MSNARDVVIDSLTSLCPACQKASKATILEHDGKVYQRSECDCHPQHESLIFSDAELYRKLDEWNDLVFSNTDAGICSCENGWRSQNSPSLAVIDITSRCNLKCPVCFAEANTTGENYDLGLETIRKMLQTLLDQPVPCRSVQFSGGEPTLHPEFPQILRMARDMGFKHIQVATNGIRFTEPGFAELCEESGLHTLYLQFDGVRDEVYQHLRGVRLLDKKLAAVRNVERTNMRLVLVPTIISGVNVDQLGPIFNFALEHSRFVTGISIQPAAEVGRIRVSGDPLEPFNLAAMAREFSTQTGLTRYPDDWFPLNAITLITRALDRLRDGVSIPPSSDAHCSIGTFFYVDDNNRPHCLNQFFDLDRFFRGMNELSRAEGQGVIAKKISQIRQLQQLAQCLKLDKMPKGLSFDRVLRSLDAYEDKTEGRSTGWANRGFNGIFVAGMHFMDARNYNLRRLSRCIIQYVSPDGQLIPFCSYNSGKRLRDSGKENCC